MHSKSAANSHNFRRPPIFIFFGYRQFSYFSAADNSHIFNYFHFQWPSILKYFTFHGRQIQSFLKLAADIFTFVPLNVNQIQTVAAISNTLMFWRPLVAFFWSPKVFSVFYFWRPNVFFLIFWRPKVCFSFYQRRQFFKSLKTEQPILPR